MNNYGNREMRKMAEQAREDSEIMAGIAKDTKEDSSAMKTIAIVTMFYLPGAFVAVSLAFLCPIHRILNHFPVNPWHATHPDQRGPRTRDNHLHSAFARVVVPLVVATAGTFAFWYIWLRLGEKKVQRTSLEGPAGSGSPAT